MDEEMLDDGEDAGRTSFETEWANVEAYLQFKSLTEVRSMIFGSGIASQ
jgi:hypothetical protein